MNGTEIITFLTENLPTIASAVGAVTGGLFTAIFLRHNTATIEFEKIKAGQFREVADDLLKAGEMTHTEYYKARNFLTVAERADEYYSKMPKRTSFDEYDFDWFIRFYEAVGNISNKEMQNLWAKILAGEISHPGTYSLRAIDVLKNFNKADAELFEKVCLHSVCHDGIYFLPRYDKFLEEVGISYFNIMNLSELGLIYNDSTLRWTMEANGEMRYLVTNRDLAIIYSSADGGNYGFDINSYPFTQVGCEIASIGGVCMTDDEFLTFANELKNSNKKVSFRVNRIKSWEDGQIIADSVDLLA